MIHIDKEKCNACTLCEKSCPFGAITVKGEWAEVGEACTLCGSCVNVCPQKAINIERIAAPAEELAKYKGVLIFVECEEKNDRLHPKRVAYELLAKGA